MGQRTLPRSFQFFWHVVPCARIGRSIRIPEVSTAYVISRRDGTDAPTDICQPAISKIDCLVTVVLNVATDIYLISIPLPVSSLSFSICGTDSNFSTAALERSNVFKEEESFDDCLRWRFLRHGLWNPPLCPYFACMYLSNHSALLLAAS